MTKLPKQRAVLYMRYSTIHQKESSIDEQRMVCLDYAKAHGLTVVAEYSDPGISGGAMGNRPDFQRMFASAKRHEFEVLLALDTSRISRSHDLSHFCNQMRFLRIQVIGVREGFDTGNAGWRIQASVSGMMSEHTLHSGGERVHIALESRARDGKPTGSVLYGYTAKHEIIAEEAAVVREIFETYARTGSMRDIVERLNARGIPGPGRRADKLWIVPTLRNMLTNQRYVGILVWNKLQWLKDPDSGRKKSHVRPESEWIVREAPQLAIVDRKTFAAVAARLVERANNRGGQRRGTAYKFPLSGFLKCGVCGSNLALVTAPASETSKGERCRAYQCSTARNTARAGCSNDRRVTVGEIERVVLSPILAAIESPKAEADLVAATVKAFKRQAAASAKERVSAPADCADLDAQVAELRGLVLAKSVSSAMAERLFGQIDLERRNRTVVTRLPAPKSDVFTVAKETRETLQALRANLHSGDAESIRAIVAKQYPERAIVVEPKGDALAVRIPRYPVALAFAVGDAVTNKRSGTQSFISYELATLPRTAKS